jgi:hypothetical protein
MEPTSRTTGSFRRGLHDLLSSIHAFFGSRHPFFARMSFAAFCVLFVGWLFLVVIRLIILTRIIKSFGVDLLMALPVDPDTASVISSVVSTVALFSIDAVISFVLLGKNKARWRFTTVAVGLLAIGASVYTKKDVLPGCYVITPDRGPVLFYPDKDHKCGPDPSTGLQAFPLTPGIILSLRAMKNGVMPNEVDPSTLDPNALYGKKDARSLYWYHYDTAGHYRIFDGAGFDPATRMPLEPVTPQNDPDIKEFCRHQTMIKAQEQQKREAAAKQAEAIADAAAKQARAEVQRLQEKAAAEAKEAEEKAAAESKQAEAKAAAEARVASAAKAAAECREKNTGNFGFTNTKTVTRFTVTVYVRGGSEANRTVIVLPGQTQYIYDFPAGAHNYLITYRAQVPIMSFPPGAPTMEQDVVYLRGQIYVEQCGSTTLKIR